MFKKTVVLCFAFVFLVMIGVACALKTSGTNNVATGPTVVTMGKLQGQFIEPSPAQGVSLELSWPTMRASPLLGVGSLIVINNHQDAQDQGIQEVAMLRAGSLPMSPHPYSANWPISPVYQYLQAAAIYPATYTWNENVFTAARKGDRVTSTNPTQIAFENISARAGCLMSARPYNASIAMTAADLMALTQYEPGQVCGQILSYYPTEQEVARVGVMSMTLLRSMPLICHNGAYTLGRSWIDTSTSGNRHRFA